MVQAVLEDIDSRIRENIRADELARQANYSTYHFCRVFMALTGTPVMAYVARRKLAYALYDLARGGKVIDVAMEYGFETHAGFTKAFKKCYGCPPSLYRLHVMAGPPGPATVEGVKKMTHGGITMQVQIREIAPFTVAGVASRHALPNVRRCADIPAYWHTIAMDYGKHLARLYDAFTPARHGEYALCFNVDECAGEFTYLLGVEFGEGADESKLEPDMRKAEIPGGLYAVFTTPKVPNEQYPQSIADTWAEILTRWLPGSPYAYDDARPGFEAYDERDHAWLHDGMVQMDICVPVIRKA
jgi:AraC family transcriptional regulator